MELSFRPAAKEDLPFLYRVYRSTRISEPGICTWSEAEQETFLHQQFELQHIQYRANYPGGCFEIILAGGEPAGRLYVNRSPERLHIIDIALLPAYRGQGIGSGIIRQLVDESEDTARPLSLYVEFDNPAGAYYLRLGFQVLIEVIAAGTDHFVV